MAEITVYDYDGITNVTYTNSEAQQAKQPETEEMTVKGFVHAVDLNKYTKPNKEWLIKGYLPRGIYYGSMYGASGSGKSFIALDIGLTIAAGLTVWHGVPCEQAKVAYLTKEGNSSLPTRIKCWTDYHKVEYSKIRENFFEFDPNHNYGSIVMNQDSQEYTDLIEELGKLGPFGLVILDTFMVFFDGDNESDSVEMERFNNSVKNFAKELKTNVMVIHHCGKWNNSEAKNDPYFLVPDGRGSSAMKGALDYQFGVGGKIKSDKGAKFMITKTKDGDLEGEESAIYFRSIKYELRDLGLDKYGEYEKSLVIKKGFEAKILDTTTGNEKKWLEEVMKNGTLPVRYRINLPKAGKSLPYISSEDLKKCIADYFEGTKKKFTNELNPNQKGKFIERLIAAGLMTADLVGYGKYNYNLLDNTLFEKDAGIWDLPNPSEEGTGTSIELNPSEQESGEKEVTEFTP